MKAAQVIRQFFPDFSYFKCYSDLRKDGTRRVKYFVTSNINDQHPNFPKMVQALAGIGYAYTYVTDAPRWNRSLCLVKI